MRAFIADMKLRELRRARDRLTAAYDAMEREADEARDPREALAALARGLAALKVGDRRVHPEVDNLDVAARGDDALASRWVARLRVQVRQGRARADALPIYGGALGERLRHDRARPTCDDDLLGPWRVPAAPEGFVAALAARVHPDALARARELARMHASRFFDASEFAPSTPPDDLLTPEARADRAMVASELSPDGSLSALALDWRGALRLAWEDVAAWDWPAEGVAMRPVWTRNRWRLRPVMDLPTAAMVEAVGELVAGLLEVLSGRARWNRTQRLRRLEELKAPPVIVDNERRMRGESVDLLGGFGADDDPGPHDSVRRQRYAMRALDGGDTYDYASSDIGRAAAWIAAEADLARAHGRPLFVLKTDLEDFYPSVSHELVGALLTWLDVDPRVVALVRRVLSVRLPDGTRTARGLPLGLSLSRAVGEFIVTAMRGAARAAAEVETAAMVDDVVVLARDGAQLSRAWAALGDVARAAGLSLHPTKSGAAAVGAALPDDVPRGPVRWGMLVFEGGGFVVDDAAVDRFAALTRARFEAHRALLDRVAVWREQLRYVWTWLAPSADLGPAHVAAAGDAATRVCDGLADALRREVAARYLGGASTALPDAWLHWPLTAGGLGAPYLPADLVPLLRASERRARTPMPAPVEAPETDARWGRWFAERLEPVKPEAPVETPSMTALEARFVERGKRVGRDARALSPYWKWVLHTLGPDVLDAYGTFDFVSTDLVPIDLVRRDDDG